MKRTGLGLIAAGVLGFVVAGDASACCHKKKAVECAPAPAPVVCEAPAPVACEAPAKKKHHFKMKMPKMGCHKKKAVEVCETPTYYYAPVAYQTATPQSYAAPQSAPTSQMPAVPSK